MATSNPRYNTVPPSIRLYSAAERLSRLQIDLVSEAVRRAVDDAGAAIGHQLSEPLTALLLYLNEIKRSERVEGAAVVPPLLSRMVDSALREAQRVCDILERIGKTAEEPIDADTAVARGHAAINAWTRKSDTLDDSDIAPVQPYANHHLLTPREHEVLALITGGASNKEGGHQLRISTRTFEVHRAHLMGKLGARNAADLVRIALSNSQ
jgi:DNA-binding CsgD family transcriptional regulator